MNKIPSLESSEQFPTRDLIQVLCEFNSCKIYNLKNLIVKNYEKNLEFIKSKNLRTTHLKMNVNLNADGLTLRGPSSLFALRGFKNLTVEDYYKIRHSIDLQCLSLPCIVVKGGGEHVSFFPLEVIEVIIA